MKLDQMLVYCVINISNMLLAQCGDMKLPQSSKLFENFLKIIGLAYIYQLAKFGDFMSCGSKDIFKNASCLMY